MGKKTILIASALLLSIGANAQTAYNITKLSDNQLDGTARFVGMGGAMGALGGDISTMGTNPAGIGVYRSNDLMVTFGASDYSTEAKSGNLSYKNDNTRGSFDNFGFVYSNKLRDYGSLKYFNFGFNYHRSKSLYGNLSVSQSLNSTSQIEQMRGMANNIPSDYNPQHLGFDDGNVSWLAVDAYNTYLIDRNSSNSFSASMPVDANSHYNLTNNFRSRERGGVDAYDINGSINLLDKIYLGATLGLYDVDYSKYTAYDESFSNSDYSYNIQSWNKLHGSGVDLKLGAIIRPIQESSFRIGLAVHTPIFYDLTLTTSTRAESNFANANETVYKDSQEDLGGDTNYDFQMRTPWKFNGSLGYVVGGNLALGAEYEYQDYSSSKLYYSNGDDMTYQNNAISGTLKGVNTFKIGAEYKVIPEFALRAGYNFTSAAYDPSAFKDLDYTSINTDTDFSNDHHINSLSFGFGYRGHNFYADFAYLYTHYNSDFHPFTDPDASYAAANLSKVTNDINSFKFTLGYRF
jgi:hypothetical protein